MKYLIAFLIASGFISLLCAWIYNERQGYQSDRVAWPYYYSVVTIVSGFALALLSVS